MVIPARNPREFQRWVVVAITTAFTVALTPLSALASDVDDFANDLASSDHKKRRQAAYELNQLGAGAADALPALIVALDDDDVQVFFHTVTALARIGPEASDAVPALVMKLGGADRRYREQSYIRAAFALGRIGKAAVPALREALKSDDESTCAFSAEALGHMEAKVAEPAVPELVALLGDRRELVQARVPKTLAKQGAALLPRLESILKEGTDAERAGTLRTLGTIGAAAKPAGPSMIDVIRATSADSNVLAAALPALVRVRHDPQAAVELLSEHLASESDEVWESAADATVLLGAIHPNIDTSAFGSAMKEVPELTRLRYADVLKRLGPASAPCVSALLGSAQAASKPEAAAEFAAALAGVGAAACQPLLHWVEKTPPAEVTPESWMASAVAGMGAPALDDLIAGLSAESASTRTLSALGIGSIGDEASAARDELFGLLEDASPEVRGAALAALPSIGVTAAEMRPLLTPLMKDPSEAVRAQAYRSAGNLKDDAQLAVPLLIEGTTDPSSTVRLAAITSLGTLGSQAASAIPALQKILKKTEEDDTATPTAVITSMGKMGGDASSAVDDLVVWLSHPKPDVRGTTLTTLGAIGTKAKGAMPDVRETLTDPHASVRLEAVKAIPLIEDDGNKLAAMLIRAIQDRESEVQNAAITELSNLGDKARPAAPRLFALLREEADIETKPVIDAIRNIRVRDIDLYISILDNPNASVRLFAAEAVGRFGSRGKKALPALRKLTNDEYDFVRSRARRAIERIQRNR